MRRIFAALIALAFLCVSSTPPAAAMPAQASEHQAHCAGMPAPEADHHQAPEKSPSGQKCCFAAVTSATLGNRVASGFVGVIGKLPSPELRSVGRPGGNWTTDPPPPRQA